MHGGSLCGRPVHVTQTDIDVLPSCLMHSSDPTKRTGALRSLFGQEIEAILTAAGGSYADFSRFVFPDYTSPLSLRPTCNFSNAKFLGKAFFEGTKFAQDATFEFAAFLGECTFRGAEFMHDADFFEAKFEESACFAEVRFDRNAFFSQAKFRAVADFHSARFGRISRFRATTFTPPDSLLGPLDPSPIFSLASFAQPTVLFYKTHLERALFVNCDVTNVMFSAVSWRKRKGNGKAMLFEEVLPLKDHPYSFPLCTAEGLRNFELIAQLYQQLQKNYDRRGDYRKAGEFHYGAMEMQRLSISDAGKWIKLQRWWHPNMSLIAWYRYASLYGESSVRPAALFTVVLCLFTLLYPLIGLKPSTPSEAVPQTYSSVWSKRTSFQSDVLSEAALVGRGAIAALDTATFQRTTELTPVYPWGRLAAICETLMTSSLFALFLLAVRRQFRR